MCIFLQVNMIAIAETFFQLFEAEHEDSVYWIFSSFVKKLESLLVAKEDMVRMFVEDSHGIVN